MSSPLADTIQRATISSAQSIRILILPLGRMAQSIYTSYLRQLRRLGTVIPLSALTYHAPSKDTPFKTMNWKKGKMKFEFVDGAKRVMNEDGEESIADEDDPDTIAYVAAPSTIILNYDWDELHVYSKIMGVICITHVPGSDLNANHAQFQDVRAQLLHPGGPFIYKCFAFDAGTEPTSTTTTPTAATAAHKTATPIKSEREHWSMIPSVSEGGSFDDAHIDFYLQTCLHDFAAGLLDNFEASIKKLSTNADLKSPLEAVSITATNTSSSASLLEQQQARAKKVRSGRQKKYVGDYCLLAGDHVAAMKHFKSASDACRNSNDSIWQASALEGQASSLVAGDDENDKSSYLESVVELFEESLNLMAKVPYAAMLSIETSFKLARYLLQWEKKCEAADILTRMYESKMDCSAHDQISLAVECAILCHQLGFVRKYGFFLVQAAGLYRELHQSASCHTLLRMATPVFRLDGFTQSVIPEESLLGFEHEPCTTINDALLDSRQLHLWEQALSGHSAANPLTYLDHLLHMSPSKQKERGYRVGRWVTIHKSLLEHLIFSAKQMQDPVLTANCTAYLLRTLYPWLETAYQSSIVSDLMNATKLLPINTDTIDMTGLPILHSIRPIELQPELAPWEDPLFEEKKEAPVTNDDTQPHLSIDPTHPGDHHQSTNDQLMGTCFRLRRAEAAAASHADVFLSRPDELHKKQPAKLLRYVCNESVDVEVFISNPLKVSLLIQHLSLSTSGVQFQAFTVSCTLLPETSNQRILLSGIPKSTGTLLIRGVHIRIFNAMWEHRVDELGIGIRPTYDDPDSSSYLTIPPNLSISPVNVRSISILPPLPQLTLSYHLAGNLSSTLLTGEIRRAQLILQNVGPLAIEDMDLFLEQQYLTMSQQSQDDYYQNPAELAEIQRNLAAKQLRSVHPAASPRKNPTTPSRKHTLESSEAPPSSSLLQRPLSTSSSHGGHPPPAVQSSSSSALGSRKTWIKFDPSALKAHLPLKAGHVIKVPLEIMVHPECCGVRFLLTYAAHSTSHLFRCINTLMTWKVDPGLVLKNVHIYQTATPSTTCIEPSASSASTQLPATPNPTCLIAAYPSSPSVVSPQPPRTSDSDCKIITADSDCMMILELSNTTSIQFYLSCRVDGAFYKSGRLLIDKSSDQRLIFTLPRMSFGHQEDQYLRFHAHRTANQSTEKDGLFRKILARFHERVKLTWSSSDESHGTLMDESIADQAIEITPSQLARLLPEPIEFQTSLIPIEIPTIQGSATSPSSSEASLPLYPSSTSPTPSFPSIRSSFPLSSVGLQARVGDFHQLTVRLTLKDLNLFQTGELELSVFPYQESVNGQFETELEGKLILVGTLTKQFTIDPRKETTFLHTFQVCFISVGRFHWEFQVKQRPQRQSVATAKTMQSSVTTSSSNDPFEILLEQAANLDLNEPLSKTSPSATTTSDSTIPGVSESEVFSYPGPTLLIQAGMD